MVDDEDYTPAVRPPNAPGGDRVRFEREGAYEHSLFGGGAEDIEASIMRSTTRNVQIIGWNILGVSDTVGEVGAGTLQSITFQLERNGERRDLTINGIGLEVVIS